jgi:hypothetical protein
LHRWTVLPEPQALTLQEPPERVLLRERVPTARLLPELQPWVPEPWELPGRAQGPGG